MEVVRLPDAKPYEAPGHFDMRGLRLQGHDASGAESFWVGLSYFLPGGGVEMGATPVEKVYVVLEGEVTVTTEADAATLGPLDSCRLAPDEARAIANRGSRPATMLVIMPYAPGRSAEPAGGAAVDRGGRP